MNDSLKVRVNIHVCHKAIVYYHDKTDFTSFEKFCTYIHKFLSNDYYIQNLPRFIKKILFDLVDDVNVIFGFSQNEILGIVIEFFNDKQWEEYSPLVFPIKKMYDPIF